MLPKFSTEYIAQGVDPKTKVIRYQSAGPDEKKLVEWFKGKAISGTFAGLECHIEKRYLINGRPFHFTQKHILWALIVVLAAFNIWLVIRG